MKRISAICVLSALALGCSSTSANRQQLGYTLGDLQGAWWADCDAPAAEFQVTDDTYSGDFVGQHTLRVDGNIVTFSNGLLGNHGIHVSGRPLRFRIVRASSTQLVLRSVDMPDAPDWTLQSCANPSASSLVPTPFRDLT